MADLDLEAIRARVAAATEGPWAWEATGDKDGSWAIGLVMDDEENALSGEIEKGQGIVVEGICDGISAAFGDAEFIAHARSDVPALLAELASERRRREQADRNWEAACEETEIARSWARFLHDHLAEQGSGVVPEGLPGWIYDRIGYDGLDRHIVERAMLRQALADLLDATGTPITQEWHEAARRAREVLGRSGADG